MQNRIHRIHLANLRLDPSEAEVEITVSPERVTSTTQVRGRLMGPRCLYASTVEVAYPLREGKGEGRARQSLRVIIPEPCWWDPQSPFLYEGPVELWQDGQRCDQVAISHGLRLLHLGPQGLRWNGRLLTLRGAARGSWHEEDAHRLHQMGGNTLLVPVTAENTHLWTLADRLGFLVLGRILDRDGMALAAALSSHVAGLGWVLTGGLEQAESLRAVSSEDLAVDGRLVGLEVLHKPSAPLPKWVRFLLCPEDLLGDVAEIPLPKILSRRTAFPAELSMKDSARPGEILGWIYG